MFLCVERKDQLMLDLDSVPENRQGYILFLPCSKGSKSESLQPYLVGENGLTIRLFKVGDNPFTNSKLRVYHLKYCRVSGFFDEESSSFKVQTIETLPPFGIGNDH